MFYYNPDYVNLEMKRFDTIESDGNRFYVNSETNSVQRVEGNPWFDNIKPTDIALDLGANIGAITIPLAKKAKRVYAVEPLYDDLLLRNIELNNLKNVTIWPIGIGNGNDTQIIKFGQREKAVKIYPFSFVKENIRIFNGGIDWLKMDIESFEWTIEPEEFRGIRELRIEFHIRHGHVKEHRANLKRWLDWMDKVGYEKVIEHPKYGPDPYDAEDWVVRASLENIA